MSYRRKNNIVVERKLCTKIDIGKKIVWETESLIL